MQQLRVDELKDFVQSHQAERPLLLDVRESWEVQTARLDLVGAEFVHLPMHLLPLRLAELDPARPILALCHHGARSLQCVAYLLQHGYPHAYNIAGGIDAWSREIDPAVARY